MAYIGKQPVVGNFVKLDAIVTSATATYNLLNGGVAYFPQSANNCIVSLNGIIQEPTSSGNVGGYTISGSTIVFTSALTTLDVIDFILVLGDTLSIGTPSDGTVSFAKVTSNLITGATAETSIAGGDSVLIYDDSASALRKMTRTNFVAGIGATAGQVIQVVSATDSTERTTSSTSYVTGSNTLSVSITPASASNKILIIASTNCWGNGSGQARFTLYKNSTDLSSGGNGFGYFEQNNIASPHGASSFTFLDSPNTTSATTYQVYMKIVTYPCYMNFGNTTGSITCLEIKG